MSKTYIITAAQEMVGYTANGHLKFTPAPLHRPFAANIQRYAKFLNAEVIVIPFARGKYFGLNWSVDKGISKRGWKVLYKDQKLCKHLKLAMFGVSGQQRNPLTGLADFSAEDCSFIMGHPKQHLIPQANANNGKLPKVQISSGCVTLPHYKKSRPGEIARREHTYGFIVVEVDGNDFYFRPVRALANGTFCDLGYKVENRHVTRAKVAALVMGDLHTGATDPEVLKATKLLVSEIKPKRIILHDIFDGRSVNHHDADNKVSQAQNFDRLSLKDEVKECGKQLSDIYNWGKAWDWKMVVVRSNHDEWLAKHIQHQNYRDDVRNLAYCTHLADEYLNRKVDPLEFGILEAMPSLNHVKWLKRDEQYQIHGVECGSHGDKGANGSRASFKSHCTTLGKCITGHVHAAYIWRLGYVVGTSTYLRQSYNVGPSSWMQTHAILYETGQVELVTFVNGKYKSFWFVKSTRVY